MSYSVLPTTLLTGGSAKIQIVGTGDHGVHTEQHIVNVDHNGHFGVHIADDNLDAFSRMRVSSPDTLFDAGFQYDLHPLIFEELNANNGNVVHSAADASARLTLDGTASGSSILQSKQYIRYIPGKGQAVFITGVLGVAVAGVKKRLGYFDANNGVFFEQNGTTDYAWTVRTDTSGSISDANRVAQANWNLDVMDGLGGTNNPSGLALSPTKSQILVIDLQWLGHGRVRVGFDIGGHIYFVHEFNWANETNSTTVYMRTANLPIRTEITGSAVASMLFTCCSVQSEGGADRHFSYQFGYTRAVISAGSGSQTYAFSVRPKATFNSITNRTLIRPIDFFTVVTGVNPVLVEVYYGTSIGGTPSWGDMDGTYSGLQVDTAGTPSGGVRAASFVVASGAAVKGSDAKGFTARYPLTLDIAGTGYNHLTVYVTGLGGASNCYPGLNWDEIR